MKKVTLLFVFLAAWLVICAVMSTPARADDPIGDALATLAAATARAEQIKSSQRATVAALSAEGTRAALDELSRQRSATATAQSQSALATQSAFDDLNRRRALTSTADARSQSATSTAVSNQVRATGTSQAVAIESQATAAALFSSAQAERSERFSFGLLVVEIFFICGACFVLWRIVKTLAAWADKMRPQPEPLFGGLIEATPASGQVVDIGPEVITPAGRMPDFVQVVNDPRIEDAISRWAEKYDRDHGEVNNGD